MYKPKGILVIKSNVSDKLAREIREQFNQMVNSNRTICKPSIIGPDNYKGLIHGNHHTIIGHQQQSGYSINFVPKYTLDLNQSKNYLGCMVYRIVANRDFGHVKKGDVGGWISKESNLSHHGDCWVGDDAIVRDKALVSEDAQVYAKAVIADRAIIKGQASVSGNALVRHFSLVKNSAMVWGSAEIYDHSKIVDSAHIFGQAVVSGTSTIGSNVQLDAGTYNNIQMRKIAATQSPTQIQGQAPQGTTQPQQKYKLDINDYLVRQRDDGSIYNIYRIVAVCDFSDVKNGDKGGYIEKEMNLRHHGNCWVYDDAKVYGNAIVEYEARVSGTSIIKDNAHISDNAKIIGGVLVSENASVYNHATVGDDTHITGNAQIFGEATVLHKAKVQDWAKVGGYAQIAGDAVICDKASIEDNAIIDGYACVGGTAKVYDHATLSIHAIIRGNAKVGTANINDNTIVEGDVQIYGGVEISGDSHIHGNGILASSGSYHDIDWQLPGNPKPAKSNQTPQPQAQPVAWKGHTMQVSVGGQKLSYQGKVEFSSGDSEPDGAAGCHHEWKEVALFNSVAYDCTKCGAKKEEI